FLVAVEGSPRRITLQSQASVDTTTGAVTVLDTIPLSDVQSIQVLDDNPSTPATDGGPEGRGFNKYLRPSGRTTELNGYTDGVGWDITYYTFPNRDTGFVQHQDTVTAAKLEVYAIPRVKGSNDFAQVYNELTAAAVTGVLDRLGGLAMPRLIPRQI